LFSVGYGDFELISAGAAGLIRCSCKGALLYRLEMGVGRLFSVGYGDF